MRFDDTSPAEFLFGKIPAALEPKLVEIKQPNSPSRLEFELLISGLLYAIVAVLLVNLYPIYELSDTGLIVLIAGFTLLSTISTWKNYIQLKRYGPDILDHNSFSLTFMVVQSYLANVLLVSALVVSYLSLQIIQFVHPAASLLFLGLIGFYVYARVVSNLSLISSGLGIGILPSFRRLSQVMYNFKLLHRISGQKEYHLASLRISFWVLIASLLYVDNGIIWQVMLVAAFTVLYLNLEKRNGSSIIMQIRSLIHSMAPSSLPIMELDDNHILAQPEEIARSTRRRWSPVRVRSDDDPIKTPTRQELTPIAARSINRIASSILEES